MFPLTAFAQTLEDNVGNFMARVYEVIINPLIVFFFALALVLFLIGMLQFFVYKQGNTEKAQEGRQHMLWGIIGMFIMVSVFGIMRILINTLGADIRI
ncbi:MAG: hypothetical protein LRY44_01020 [Candidatus Pacebacteria bacterium]|nr:hypothetical protein [Candidatus Paceibacterota bacterium]